MAGYAIIRMDAKYKERIGAKTLRGKHTKDMGDLKRMASHHERTSPVPNARQPYDTRHIIGNPSMVAGVLSCLPEQRRADAVIACEFIITTSPESQRVNDQKEGPLDDAKVQRFVDAAKEFIKEEFGDCAFGRAHFDEKTPHFAIYVVPNEDFKPGAPLNAKKMFGKFQLAEYQTKWFEKLNKFGLDVKRGEPGSEADHESIHDYYRRVNAPLPELPPVPKPVEPPTAPQKALEALGVDTDHSRAEKARQQALKQRAAAKEDQRKAAIAKARESEAKAKAAERRAVNAERNLHQLRESTSQLRAMPLDVVLEKLGATRDEKDPTKWHTQAGDIHIEKGEGLRFNSFTDPDIKGRGAIDLAMKIEGWSFDQAVKFLASEFGSERAASDLAAREAAKAMEKVQQALKTAPEPSPLPHPEPEKLPRVRRYLVEVRKVPARIVDALIERGRIFADKFANACFRTDDSAGVEKRGTVATTKWRGHYGPKTGFTVKGDPYRVAIVESSIEALSLNALDGCTCVSVGGANQKKASEIAKAWKERGATVYAAQNADKAGDDQAARLMKAVPGMERMRPPQGKDWNDQLRQMPPEQRQQLEVSAKPSPAVPVRTSPAPR